MSDSTEHVHSNAAYQVMFEHEIGIIGAEESIVNDNFILTDSFIPQDTEIGSDFKRNQFLNLELPLLVQVWNSNFSKSFYLQQVHQPRHLSHSAKLFSQPWLEVFTLTPWWVVPLIWLPITFYLFYRSLVLQPNVEITSALGKTMLSFIGGNVVWTILEYTLHRFLFHVDDMLPDTPFFLMLHFLLHGIHHYLPVRLFSFAPLFVVTPIVSTRLLTCILIFYCHLLSNANLTALQRTLAIAQMDRLRLVMPPLLFTALSFPFVKLAFAIFPAFVASGVISGAFFFYVGCEPFLNSFQFYSVSLLLPFCAVALPFLWLVFDVIMY